MLLMFFIQFAIPTYVTKKLLYFYNAQVLFIQPLTSTQINKISTLSQVMLAYHLKSNAVDILDIMVLASLLAAMVAKMDVY